MHKYHLIMVAKVSKNKFSPNICIILKAFFRLRNGISFGNMALYIVGLTAAVMLKYHYSRASGNDLLWILYPTAFLVEQITGLSFVMETYTGFINYSKGIVIAPACGGVNFLIIAFCTVFFSTAHRIRSLRGRWLWLGITLMVSYLLTVGVNSLRIVLSIFLYEHNIHYGWLTTDRIHRIEGAIVYFFFLSTYYLIMRRIAVHRGEGKEILDMSSYGRRVMIAAIPLFWYFLITLGVPLLNGNYLKSSARFVEHSWMIGLSCLFVFLAIQLIRIMQIWRARRTKIYLKAHADVSAQRSRKMSLQSILSLPDLIGQSRTDELDSRLKTAGMTEKRGIFRTLQLYSKRIMYNIEKRRRSCSMEEAKEESWE